MNFVQGYPGITPANMSAEFAASAAMIMYRFIALCDVSAFDTVNVPQYPDTESAHELPLYSDLAIYSVQ